MEFLHPGGARYEVLMIFTLLTGPPDYPGNRLCAARGKLFDLDQGSSPGKGVF
jgi:hypothetical protein